MSRPADPPPPLPPKTRRSPTATVLVAANHDSPPARLLPEAFSSDDRQRHVVKIRINTGDEHARAQQPVEASSGGCVRISVGGGAAADMVRRATLDGGRQHGGHYFFCNGLGTASVASSGQSSPSDTLDSGTCSDLDGGTPPPPPPKKRPPAVTVTVNGGRRQRAGSHSSGAEVDGSDIDDEDEDDDRISCDSLNSGRASHPGSDEAFEPAAGRFRSKATITLAGQISDDGPHLSADDEHSSDVDSHSSKGLDGESRPSGDEDSGVGLRRGLLQDIRERTSRLSVSPVAEKETRAWGDAHRPLSARSSTSSCAEEPAPARKAGSIVEQRTYEDRRKESEDKKLGNGGPQYDADVFYKFHVNETFDEAAGGRAAEADPREDSFAGFKDLLEGKQASATIRSAKGTVRGVKNRVRAGITTFLQLHATKSYKEKEAGKVVLYTTTMGVVRRTHQDCVAVKKILRNLMVKYEERDVFMSREHQAELRDRLSCETVLVPQMFVEGQLVGDREAIEKLNESGELRRFLKPYRSPDACSECRVCGGHRLLPCPVCNGSKKSVHRNHFTAEFVALKCMNCDEVGLVRCHAC
ncbi:glutaredoxin domain-containing cysteine-rich protein CG31559-like [Bacillus rossius redtenbacheri]|uniref:glutaredoxin domain-containing cysteine-rich protein CG31559-like n=1 Tax=Bacillus rossius redtenbacheri TaxID=93214 RepID=UPI002FDC8D57